MPNLFLNAISQLGVSLCLAANLSCQPSCQPSAPNMAEQSSHSRLASARYLIARAQTLEQINELLLDRLCKLKEPQDHVSFERQNGTNVFLAPAIDKGSVLRLCDARHSPTKLQVEDNAFRKPADEESQQAFENVYQKYQIARMQYLQHRQQYDEHVREFHQEAKQDNRALPPLTVPNVKPLKVMAEDQCRQLQILEQQLKNSEQQILSTIQALESEKGKINPDAYFQQWINSQSMAMNVQRIAMTFNQGVAQKDQLTSEQLHEATQSAILNGDAIQSSKTYMETQRRTALANAEAQRAQLHSQLASSFLIYINALSPLAQRAQNTSTETPEQLESESNSLQTEYDRLQEQYSDVEKLNPAMKKGR